METQYMQALDMYTYVGGEPKADRRFPNAWGPEALAVLEIEKNPNLAGKLLVLAPNGRYKPVLPADGIENCEVVEACPEMVWVKTKRNPHCPAYALYPHKAKTGCKGALISLGNVLVFVDEEGKK
jgi:hypothetical protein